MNVCDLQNSERCKPIRYAAYNSNASTTMDIDSREVVESVKKAVESEWQDARRLNAAGSMTVALIATIMAICKIKDGNVVQAMELALTNKRDHWAYYQAKTARLETAQAGLLNVWLGRLRADKTEVPYYDEVISFYQKSVEDLEVKRAGLRNLAKGAESKSLALNQVDDQLGLAQAGLTLSMVLIVGTVLTNSWFLLEVAMTPASLELPMGVSGFLGWPIHPAGRIRTLS